MNGIINLYYSFLEYLHSQQKRIVVLQLCGKIEDYLVKEFVYFVYESSGGNNFALVNHGSKNEQKIDICLIQGKIMDEIKIYGMIEAKYFRNKHRFWNSTATDEIGTTLKDMDSQLHIHKKLTHGEYGVKLKSKTDNIYGLVFASYINENKNEEDKKIFYKKILNKAKKNFRYHDHSEPYFRPVFNNVNIKFLDSSFYVTLKAGLWRKK
jgi:hypothetical protein